MESENLSTREDVDRELLQRLTVQLRERGFAPYRTLGLCVENGVVELQGRLPTYHLRQVAVECIKRVAGVRRVVDRIAVDPTSYPPPASVRIRDEHGGRSSHGCFPLPVGPNRI